MRKQVWYFKFGYSILGPVIEKVKWAGRTYDPEKLPKYVYDALGMKGHKFGTRAILYPSTSYWEGSRRLDNDYPQFWRWNRVEITPP